MARSRTPKFDASEVITNEIIRIIERGVLPWRKPWTAGGSTKPLRVGGEPYQGVNNFLLTMRTVMAGHSSPFWMTLPHVTSRQVVWLFFKQLWFEFVPVLHGLQGRFTAQG